MGEEYKKKWYRHDLGLWVWRDENGKDTIIPEDNLGFHLFKPPTEQENTEC